MLRVSYNRKNQYSHQALHLRLSLDFQEPFGGKERGGMYPRPVRSKVLNFRESRYVLFLDSMPHTAHSRRPCASLRHPDLEVLSDPSVLIHTPRDALSPRLGRRRKLEAVACARRGVLDPNLDDPGLAGHGQLVHDE